MQIFTLILPGTWFFILALVLLAIAAFLLRLKLYKKLQQINSRVSRLLVSGEEEGVLPEIVNRLRSRYQKASQKLEHVNTLSLIDSMYKGEEVGFLGFKVQFDRAEGITRAIPNLLIAFGLVGTFWGITSNLSNISDIVTNVGQSDSDVNGLVQRLQSPLQDMGIAFSTSLFGLVFGSALTIANTILNTSIVRYQLFSSLEDYLDNIYKPTVEGNTRLDVAIDRMVRQQEEFLTRFHENVGAVLERTFGQAANQIAEECGRINTIAEYVYSNFSNAAGTISTGATTFHLAATSLESQTTDLADSLHEFKSGIETFKIAANQIEKNNIVQNLDRVLAQLSTNQQAFASSTQILQDSLAGIISSNETATKLATQVYETWQDSTSEIGAVSEKLCDGAETFQKSAYLLEEQIETVLKLIPQLENGVATFASAANKVETNKIITRLNTLVESFSINQSTFINSTQTFTADVDRIMSSHLESTQRAENIYQGLEATTTCMQSGANDFIRSARIIRDSSLGVDLDNASNKLQYSQNKLNQSITIFSQAVTDLQPIASKLEPAITSLDQAVSSLQQVGSEIVNLVQVQQHNQS